MPKPAPKPMVSPHEYRVTAWMAVAMYQGGYCGPAWKVR